MYNPHAKKLLDSVRGKTTSILTHQQITDAMKSLKKQLFLPTTFVESCKVYKTQANENLCPITQPISSEVIYFSNLLKGKGFFYSVL